MKRAHWLLISGFLCFIGAGCLTILPGPGALKAVGIEAKINRYVPKGSSIAQVNNFLQKRGIKHGNSADGTGSITRSQIRLTRIGFLASENLEIAFFFNYQGRLDNYVLEPWSDGL